MKCNFQSHTFLASTFDISSFHVKQSSEKDLSNKYEKAFEKSIRQTELNIKNIKSNMRCRSVPAIDLVALFKTINSQERLESYSHILKPIASKPKINKNLIPPGPRPKIVVAEEPLKLETVKDRRKFKTPEENRQKLTRLAAKNLKKIKTEIPASAEYKKVEMQIRKRRRTNSFNERADEDQDSQEQEMKGGLNKKNQETETREPEKEPKSRRLSRSKELEYQQPNKKFRAETKTSNLDHIEEVAQSQPVLSAQNRLNSEADSCISNFTTGTNDTTPSNLGRRRNHKNLRSNLSKNLFSKKLNF